MPRKTILFLSTFLLWMIAANSQQLINDKIDVKAGSSISNVNAVIYLPANYSSTKKYPLVIYTHGAGEASSDINMLYNTGLPQVLKGGYRPSFDFIMVAAQRSAYSVDPAWLEGILESSKARWSIDEGRIYLTGISAGGWGVYGSQLNFSTAFASKFAAIMIYAGNDGNTNKANFDWWKTTKTPVWALAGEADSYYAGRAKFMSSQINDRVPGLASLSIRPGYGHGGWNDVYNGSFKNGTKTLWDWFYQFNRNSPTYPDLGGGTSTPPSTGSTVPTAKAVPGRIEAESYDGMSGIQTEATQDVDGVKNVGWLDAGDWMDYNINVSTAGNYTVTFRLAAPSTGAQFQVKKADGTVLTTVDVPNTGSFQTWVSKTAVVNLGAGIQTLRISSTTSNWNFNWMSFAYGGSSPSTSTTVPTTGTFANYTIGGGNQVYLPNGLNIPNLKPGDTVNIKAGTYSLIDLGNFSGTPALPIVIRNTGGQVIVSKVRLGNQKLAQYFKFLGNGKAGVTYGFKISGGGQGITANRASDYEIAYCEISNQAVGIMSKMNPVSTDITTVYPNFWIRNLYIHHNYLHDNTGEGMYIGHTDPDGGQAGNPLIPIQLENIEIAYNIVERSGWDGIQLNDANNGNKIHHNTITDYGTKNAYAQQVAIILGGHTNGDVYDNVIKNGTGVGIGIGGYGHINVYNNTIENPGRNGKVEGDVAIYSNDYIYFNDPKQELNIYNNTIRNPMPKGAIRIANNRFNALPGAIQNNKIYIPGASSNWQSLYIFGILGTTISGNTLLTN